MLLQGHLSTGADAVSASRQDTSSHILQLLHSAGNAVQPVVNGDGLSPSEAAGQDSSSASAMQSLASLAGQLVQPALPQVMQAVDSHLTNMVVQPQATVSIADAVQFAALVAAMNEPQGQGRCE